MSSVRYHTTRVDDVTILTHRLIWEESYGPIPDGCVIDHINGDTFDNRLENLRLCTQSQNVCNARLRSDNKYGVKGLKWLTSKRPTWQGAIKANGKVHTKNGDLLTVIAWLFRKRIELHGEFAKFQ